MTDDASIESRIFLFTDIESSTRLWQEHPAAMHAAIARHDDILRGAVEEAGGTVVKTTGDGLMAVFTSAEDALTACLDAQRRLQTEPWDEIGTLRVRMGIHAGEAQARAGDYFGPPVNRASRIMTAAHGGQILLSAAAAHLATGKAPTGTELRDLGEHRLKDLFQPERIFQVVHPDLVSTFPPLSTLSERPNNLPIQTSEFFGRDMQLQSIRQLLDSAGVRLVTLVGPGGIGKTRLALQAAAEQIDRYEDGVFFVDLAPVQSPDATFETIVRAVGLTGASDERPFDVLTRQLRSKRMLVLLDNFEHVIDAAGGVAELLGQCPDLNMLVTSREALNVRGEHLVPVPPLALPDGSGPPGSLETVAGYEAVRLFVERARAARPDFALSDQNLAAVVEICTRLDGMPLAIELAASRLKLFSPEELRARLRTRLDVLSGGPRDLPARQRTLRNTIAWSYELLDEEERAVVRLLSVFAPTGVESVEGVAARIASFQPVDVLDRLSSLIDKSLIRSVAANGHQRLSMYETIREFSAERLNADPELHDATAIAHAAYFADFAMARRQSLHGPDRDDTLANLEAEIGNLTRAWHYWVHAGDLEHINPLLDCLWALYDARGWYHAAVELANDLLGALSSTPETADRAREEIALRLSLARGLMAIHGYTDEIEAIYYQALALSEQWRELPNRAPVLRSIASFYMFRGEFTKTVTIGRELLALGEQQNDTLLQVDGNLLVGSSLTFSGDVRMGMEHIERAVALVAPQAGSGRFRFGPHPGIVAHTTSALMHWMGGFPDRALQRATRAIELARQMNHPYTLAYAIFHVGVFDMWRQEFELVEQWAREVLDISRDQSYQIWEALALVLLGTALCGLGRSDEGLNLVEQGTELYQGSRTPPIFWPLFLSMRAQAHGLGGRHAEGLVQIDGAIATVGDDLLLPVFTLIKGNLLAAMSDLDTAEDIFQHTLDMATRHGSLMPKLQSATKLTRLRRAAGKTPDGTEILREVYAQFTEGFDRRELAEARELLSE